MWVGGGRAGAGPGLGQLHISQLRVGGAPRVQQFGRARADLQSHLGNLGVLAQGGQQTLNLRGAESTGFMCLLYHHYVHGWG